MGDSSEKDKKRLCGNPRDQQESARRYSQHQERAEMMIITPTAKRTSFFHADKAYPASLETDSQIFDLSQHSKDTGRRDECHGGLLFPPERGEP
jgi:hypothetical protein